MNKFKILAVSAMLALGLWSAAVANTTVIIKTSLGDITVELFDEKAPLTVKNFLGYVDNKFYNGTIFHRVIDDFMIQGGGFDQKFSQKPTKSPVANEADKGVKNDLGTIAMARTNDPHSATAQFFINLKANSFLDHKAKTPAGWGYCAFGKVIEGMEVVNKIKAVSTGNRGGHSDVPKKDVIINEIVRVPVPDKK